MATSPGRARDGARKGEAARAGRGRPKPPAVDMSPARYIVKVDRATGEPLSDPIDPADLLVHAHRDRHPVEIAAQFLASRLVRVTGNEGLVRRGLGLVEAVGSRVGRTVGELTGNPEDGRAVKRLLGVTTRDYVYQFREPTHLSEKELKARVLDLQKQARTKLAGPGEAPPAARAAHRGDRLPGQGDPGAGRQRPARGGDRLGRPPGDDPRPQDEGGRGCRLRPGARGAAAEEDGRRRAGRRGSSVSSRATSSVRGSGSTPAELERLEEQPDPRRPLRGERLLRRHLRELVPRRTCSAAATRSPSRRRCRRPRARPSWRTWRSRPRTSTAAASARSPRRTRSSSRATSTTTTTS